MNMLVVWNFYLQIQQFHIFQSNILLIYRISIFLPPAYPGRSPHKGRHFCTFCSLLYLQCLEQSDINSDIRQIFVEWINELTQHYFPYTLLHCFFITSWLLLFLYNILFTVILQVRTLRLGEVNLPNAILLTNTLYQADYVYIIKVAQTQVTFLQSSRPSTDSIGNGEKETTESHKKREVGRVRKGERKTQVTGMGEGSCSWGNAVKQHVKIILSPSGPPRERGALQLPWDSEPRHWHCSRGNRVWTQGGSGLRPTREPRGLPDSSSTWESVLALLTTSSVDEIGGHYLQKTPQEQCCCFKRLLFNLSMELYYQEEQVNSICKWRSSEFEICQCQSFPFSSNI